MRTADTVQETRPGKRGNNFAVISGTTNQTLGNVQSDRTFLSQLSLDSWKTAAYPQLEKALDDHAHLSRTPTVQGIWHRLGCSEMVNQKTVRARYPCTVTDSRLAFLAWHYSILNFNELINLYNGNSCYSFAYFEQVKAT